MNGECVSNKRRRKDCCTKDRLCGLSMFLSVCLLFSIVCLAVFSYFLFMRSKESEYCTDTQCIASAAEINEFIDDQIEPCEDFNAFVCGKFMATAYEKQMNSPYSAEEDRVESKIDKYIIEPESRDDEPAVIMQKRFFRACFNEEAIDENNNTDFRSLLNEIGGFPLLNRDDWKEQDFDWMKAMMRARQLGLPFDWFLDIDIHDSDDKYYLKISRPRSCGDFKNSPEYDDVIVHIIRDLVPNFTSATKVFEITNFERNLSQICTKMKNETLTRATVYDLEKNRDKIWPENMNFLKFIYTITAQIRNWQTNSEVFYDRYYISEIKKLLNRTDKEIQANYMAWKISQYFAPYLSKSIREAYQRYTDEYEDRFQFCLKDTKSRFNLVSEVMYIRENTPSEIVKAGLEMVTSIKNEFSEQIKNVEWMSNETKVVHINSYENLNITIGGPEAIFDENFFTKYVDVAQLSFSSDNIIRMLCDWSRRIFFVKISHVDRASTLPFNSEYITSRDLLLDQKRLYLPTHMLHGPTFELHRPYYLNYGSLGTLIAKKLIQDIIPQKTLSNDHYHNYMRNLQCLLKGIKTSNYDRNTQFFVGETNFIDLFSRHIAYSAYQKYLEDHDEELELPSVTHSPNKLFWIKSTMNLCYKRLPNIDDDIVSTLQETNENSILQSVKNSPFFGEDFGCEEDAPMNPADKCSIF